MSLHLSRRDLLRAGLYGGAVAAMRPDRLLDAMAAAPTCGSLKDVKHIVILVQENRSFDHYFGTYKGVRGFDDRSAPGGAAAFSQRVTPANTGLPSSVLPFRIDTSVMVPPQQGVCTNDIEHQWAGQHASWNQGANDGWMNSHLATELKNGQTARQAALTMGYYSRADLPFFYPLADAFTLCDAYHCSVIAGTDVNRLMSVTGTIDPDGFDGGCRFLSTKVGTVENPGADLGTAGRWKPYPQVLTEAGISWKVYGTADGQTGDNVLRYFPQFRPSSGNTALSVPAFASNAFPGDFAADCQSGQLPQVSWLLPGLVDSEHAPDPVTWGESVVHSVLTSIVTSGLWQDTVLFVTYDENGGFFDHVPPPVPAAGTAGEFLNQAALTTACRGEATTVDGVDLSGGPIGLGFRVPMLVISPWTRNPTPSAGPLVCSDLNDHTSLLRFVESWSIAKGTPARIPDRNAATRTPGLSAWRRATVGDLTTAMSFGRPADASVPTSLVTAVPNRADPRVLSECIATGTVGTLAFQPIVQDPVVPAQMTLPRQETSTGPVQRPVTSCAAGTTASGGGTGLTPTAAPVTASGAGTPNTVGSGTPTAVSVAALGVSAALALAGWRRRRMDGDIEG